MRCLCVCSCGFGRCVVVVVVWCVWHQEELSTHEDQITTEAGDGEQEMNHHPFVLLTAGKKKS